MTNVARSRIRVSSAPCMSRSKWVSTLEVGSSGMTIGAGAEYSSPVTSGGNWTLAAMGSSGVSVLDIAGGHRLPRSSGGRNTGRVLFQLFPRPSLRSTSS